MSHGEDAMRSEWTRTGVGCLLICSVVALPTSAADEDRGTIWGPDYPSTVKAMKQVVRALGVKSCLYCHVKSGGRVDFEAETGHKEIARLMKFTFVDSLVALGGGEMVLTEGDESVRISARYESGGDDPGIHLTLVEQTGEGEPARTVEGRVDLPEDGQINCATCHAGRVHFLVEEEEEG